MNTTHFDTIVLGVGGVGSATLYELAPRGQRVLGIDRFQPGHDRGSSHGESRVIRKAYFEHPNYVPLLQLAYAKWGRLEADAGLKLLHQPGLLEVGPPHGVLLQGVRAAADQFAIPLENLSLEDVASRFPGFKIPPDCQAVFEPDGGYLLVEACVTTQVALARRLGAQLAIEAVHSWHSGPEGIEVRCASTTYRADRLVITSGAWASELLGPLGIEFRVLRKHLHWFAVEANAYPAHLGSPVFFYETPAGYYYGFPNLNGKSIKVAEHSGGERIKDPLRLERTVDLDERRRVETFLRNHLSRATSLAIHHTACMYTMTADEHFIVDRHPTFSNVCFAAGLSGHGFKFTCVLGEVLADMVEDKLPTLSIDFLRLQRPTLEWTHSA